MASDRKVMVFIVASQNGYIVTKDESLERLFQVEGEEDNGYGKFFQTVDTVIMGKKTYNWIVEHEKENFPYKNEGYYVFIHSVTSDNENVRFVNEDVVQFINNLRGKKEKIFGLSPVKS